LLERQTGELVRVTPFARAIWDEVDPSTDAVNVQLTPTAAGTTIRSGPASVKEWSHAAFSSRTGLLYVPLVE
jgi:alcohol dehydrogenase (cytochrome c)